MWVSEVKWPRLPNTLSPPCSAEYYDILEFSCATRAKVIVKGTTPFPLFTKTPLQPSFIHCEVLPPYYIREVYMTFVFVVIIMYTCCVYELVARDERHNKL